ncbi:MAG TPA: hypothetical protein VGL77_11790, partial [Armatimonadota bacterium]
MMSGLNSRLGVQALCAISLFCCLTTIIRAQGQEIRIPVEVMSFVKTSLPETEVATVKKGQHVYGNGWVEYTVTAPEAGAYELWIASNGSTWEQRYLVNGVVVAETRADRAELGKQGALAKIVNVELRAGANTLRVFRDWFPGLAWFNQITLRRASEPAARIIVAPRNTSGYYRRGETVTLDLRAEALPQQAYTVDVVLEAPPGKTRVVKSIAIPAGTNWGKGSVAVALESEGAATIHVLANGAEAMRPFQVYAFETRQHPVMPTTEAAWDLVQTIDCTQQRPDFFGNGEPRLAQSTAGRYLESGANGVYTVQSRQASWFAYTVKTPDLGQWYRMDIEYPDDD